MSIELPATSGHYRDMTERLLKVTLSPNQTNKQKTSQIILLEQPWVILHMVLFITVIIALVYLQHIVKEYMNKNYVSTDEHVVVPKFKSLVNYLLDKFQWV